MIGKLIAVLGIGGFCILLIIGNLCFWGLVIWALIKFIFGN